MSEQKAVRWEKDADGIAVVTLDDPASSANTMNDAYREAMGEVVDDLVKNKDDIVGVVITSAKKTFFAGGNLDQLIAAGPDDAEQILTMVAEVKGQLRTLETFGRPVASALVGAALGGAWRSRWPPTTGSASTRRAWSTACPRSASACCPAVAASPASPACWASRTVS